jgi:hypothetical protein
MLASIIESGRSEVFSERIAVAAVWENARL